MRDSAALVTSRHSVCFSPVESHTVFVFYPALQLPLSGKYPYIVCLTKNDQNTVFAVFRAFHFLSWECRSRVNTSIVWLCSVNIPLISHSSLQLHGRVDSCPGQGMQGALVSWLSWRIVVIDDGENTYGWWCPSSWTLSWCVYKSNSTMVYRCLEVIYRTTGSESDDNPFKTGAPPCNKKSMEGACELAVAVWVVFHYLVAWLNAMAIAALHSWL